MMLLGIANFRPTQECTIDKLLKISNDFVSVCYRKQAYSKGESGKTVHETPISIISADEAKAIAEHVKRLKKADSSFREHWGASRFYVDAREHEGGAAALESP